MTAEHPLTGLVPLGYQLGDSADHARYVAHYIYVDSGSQSRTRSEATGAPPDVPFGADTESPIPLFPDAVELYPAGQ